MIDRFRYLNVGLAAVLVFVGVKMPLADVCTCPCTCRWPRSWRLLGTAVAASLLRTERTAPPARKPLTTEGGL